MREGALGFLLKPLRPQIVLFARRQVFSMPAPEPAPSGDEHLPDFDDFSESDGGRKT